MHFDFDWKCQPCSVTEINTGELCYFAESTRLSSDFQDSLFTHLPPPLSPLSPSIEMTLQTFELQSPTSETQQLTIEMTAPTFEIQSPTTQLNTTYIVDKGLANLSAPDVSQMADITQSSFDIPEPIVEPEVEPELPMNVEVGDLPPLTYTKIDGATSRSKPKLVLSSWNHVYDFKKTLGQKFGNVLYGTRMSIARQLSPS